MGAVPLKGTDTFPAKEETMRRLLMLFSVLMLLVAAAPAGADQTGDAGFIKSINLVASYAEEYPLYHGLVVLDTEGIETEYYWGGSYCPGKSLDTEFNTALLDALRQYAQSAHMLITPQYKNGQGGFLCLSGFSASSQSQDCCGCVKGKKVPVLPLDARLKGKKILQN